MNGHSDVLEVLIRYVSHLSRDYPGSHTPFLVSVYTSHGAAVGELQEQDCHRSALHLAAGSGHLSCCRLLVQRGASVSLRDSSIEGCVHVVYNNYAVYRGM